MAGERLRRPAAATVTGALAVAALVGLAACGSGTGTAAGEGSAAASSSGGGPVIDPGDGGRYAPVVDPADFVDRIDNPYLPLTPGSRWVYRATGADGAVETIEVEVTGERRTVMGISAVVVHDVVTADGEVIEDTWDWFAQDRDGNVWYLGEDTTAYDRGEASTEGSWEAGVGGALPGIAMPGTPEVSATGYRQEYLAGEAEDMAQVIEVGQEVDLDAGRYRRVVVTRDWTPLEPGVVEEKSYAPGVGMVRETKTGGDLVVLVEHRPGP